MLATLWTCPHCRSGDFLASVPDERIGLCQDCGFAYPRGENLSDDSSWREQAEMFTNACEQNEWPQVRGDRYQVIRPLASGAQGRILLAHHRHLDQICVIKILDTAPEWRELAAARLKTEARAAVLVSHPSVARFLDYDCVEDRWYFVMEYVPGENLRKMVHTVRRFNWAQVAEIIAQVAEGLAAIHDASLIHRDVKPSNIMLRTDGVPKIMDLGLVKMGRLNPSDTLTHDGQVLGTPYYMPPEQFDGDKDLPPQADIYALGATAYHLLAGKPPFQGSGIIELANRHKHDPIVWPDEVVQDVPSWLRHVFEVCLAKRPEHRIESMSALADALRRGEDVTSFLPAPPRDAAPRGIVVTSFRNLSRQPEHDWIGDAIAEYLATRLRETGSLLVVDRHNLAKVMGSAADGALPDPDLLVEKAHILGAGVVIVGTFQCHGDSIRMTARTLGEPKHARVAADVSGELDALFALEDQLAAALIGGLGASLGHTGDPHQDAGGTSNLQAHEQFIRSQRAFADGEYADAIHLADEALQLDPQYVDALSLIGACHARTGDYDLALKYHQREELAARRNGDERRIAEALGNLGVMYYYKGEYRLAYELLEKARDQCVQLGQSADRATYEGNLGFVLMRLDRPKEVEAAFARAIEIHKQNSDHVSLMWPYNGMGGVLLKQKRYAEASEYYRRASGLAEEIDDRVNVGVSHMNLGRCACLMEDYAEAEACFDEALRALEGTDFWNGMTLVYEHMADMYLKEHNLDAALACIEQRLELAEKHDNHRMESDAWEQKARAYEFADDKEKALECLKRSLEVAQRPPLHQSLHHHLSAVVQKQPFA